MGGAWEKGWSSGWGMLKRLQAGMQQWEGHGGKAPCRDGAVDGGKMGRLHVGMEQWAGHDGKTLCWP